MPSRKTPCRAGKPAYAVCARKREAEAERKRIEAQGIADFQKIVSEGINRELLQWKGIEATEKLANSSNAKVVIVGGKWAAVDHEYRKVKCIRAVYITSILILQPEG
jgi:hypothetical protein